MAPARAMVQPCRGFVGIFYVRLKGDHALGLDRLGDGEEQGQQVAIVLALPLGTAEDLAEGTEGGLGLRPAGSQQKGANAGAEDHDQLERRGVDDGFEVAPVNEVTAEDHDKYADDAGDLKHESGPLGASTRRRAAGADYRNEALTMFELRPMRVQSVNEH